jgi:hypothetical protein
MPGEEKKKYPSLAKHQKNLISILPRLPSFLDYKNISNPPPTTTTKTGGKKSIPPHKRKEEIKAITTAYCADQIPHSITANATATAAYYNTTLVHYYYLVHALEAKYRKKTGGELRH